MILDCADAASNRLSGLLIRRIIANPASICLAPFEDTACFRAIVATMDFGLDLVPFATPPISRRNQDCLDMIGIANDNRNPITHLASFSLHHSGNGSHSGRHVATCGNSILSASLAHRQSRPPRIDSRHFGQCGARPLAGIFLCVRRSSAVPATGPISCQRLHASRVRSSLF